MLKVAWISFRRLANCSKVTLEVAFGVYADRLDATSLLHRRPLFTVQRHIVLFFCRSLLYHFKSLLLMSLRELLCD